MKRFILACMCFVLVACGARVEVPPAHIGKILTAEGFKEEVIQPSKFRLPFCIWYCDKLVLLDVSDKTQGEPLTIFIPTDKLNLDVMVQVTMSLNPSKTNSLFSTLAQSSTNDSDITIIVWQNIYKTYAQQLIVTETRQYLSQFKISEIASSLDKVNSDLRELLDLRIQEKTPFTVRYAGITNIKYPPIITEAQENAAKRREQIQQEEAQLEISKVQLERELQETQLKRQIELEKAQIEAKSQQIQRDVVDEKVLKLRVLENQRLWIEKWNGQLPATVLGNGDDTQMLLNLPSKSE